MISYVVLLYVIIVAAAAARRNICLLPRPPVEKVLVRYVLTHRTHVYKIRMSTRRGVSYTRAGACHRKRTITLSTDARGCGAREMYTNTFYAGAATVKRYARPCFWARRGGAILRGARIFVDKLLRISCLGLGVHVQNAVIRPEHLNTALITRSPCTPVKNHNEFLNRVCIDARF